MNEDLSAFLDEVNSSNSTVKLVEEKNINHEKEKSINVESQDSKSDAENQCEWFEHITLDQIPYYYSCKRRESTWIKPLDFKQPTIKIAMKPISVENLNNEQFTDWRRVFTNAGHMFYYNINTKSSYWNWPTIEKEDLKIGKRKIEDSSEDSSPKKPKLEEEDKEQESSESESESNELDTEEGQINDKNSNEITFAKRVEIFRQMLREKNLLPFSIWEKELPKFAFDPRFKILQDLSDRKAVFEDFVKNKVEEERIERKEKISNAKEVVVKYMQENPNKINEKTSFDDFKKLFVQENLFKLLVTKDKEKIYDELIGPLKKSLKEKETSQKEKAKKEFTQMLKEVSDITSKSMWSKIKSSFQEDERFTTEVLSENEKQSIFKDYVKKLEEQEKRREDAKKEREREVRKEREKQELESKKAFFKINEKEVVTSYRTLLKEKIKDPQASWTRSRSLLEYDPRFNIRGLSSAEKENIFRDHLKNLQQNKQDEFKNLLKENADKGKFALDSNYDSIKKYIQEDPRYEKIAQEERREVFERFMREWKREAFTSFRELLRESKNLGMISSKTPSSGSQYDYIHQLLQKDKRYSNLNVLKEERDTCLKEFIEIIKKGTD